MSRKGLVWAAVFAVALGACLPASVRPSDHVTSAAPTPTPRADPCSHLARVYAERDSLGDAFLLVIDGKVEQAIGAAGSVRQRLEELLSDLPDERYLEEPQASLRGAVESAANLVLGGAEVIGDPRRPTPDAQLILVEGEALIGVTDWLFSIREPGDTVSRACPGLRYAPTPVPFPPRPSAQDFGLPDRAGPLFIDSVHLGRIGAGTSEIIRQLGGDPERGREIEVDVTFGEGGHLDLRVYEGVTVDTRAFASAVADGMTSGDVTLVERRVAGFQVIALGDQDEASGSLHVASRGDQLLEMWDFSDANVETLLAAMP